LKIYVAPLQGNYSEVLPIPYTAKKNSFKAIIECVRVHHGGQLQCQWKPIVPRWHNILSWIFYKLPQKMPS